MISDENIEKEIQEKRLTAERITPDRINEVIKKEEYKLFEESCLTICVLTLENGFTVTGESACASPENFNAELGKKIAKKDAMGKIWALEGYLLKQKIYERSLRN
jgi:deoxyhypusine synthase